MKPLENLAISQISLLQIKSLLYKCQLSQYTKVVCLVAQSCLTLCDPMGCSSPGFSVHGDSPDKNTGVGCHGLLQRLFPIQELNPGLPHCKSILYHLSLQGNPYNQLKVYIHYPLQCSRLENPRGGAWQAAIYGVAQSRTRLKRLSSSSSIHPLHLKRNLIYGRNHYLKGEGSSGALGVKNLPANAGDMVRYLMGRIPHATGQLSS